MALKKHQSIPDPVVTEGRSTPAAVAEEVLERKLEDITTILCKVGTDKNRIYEEVMSMVERCLVRIALRRSNHVKSAAAAYLGINRNTFQKKMVGFFIDSDPE
jgi:DNA-binding protein Fis